MQSIWSILELEPTKDVSAIKRAYARLAGKYHPEEEPELFLQLRQAYQAALNYAQGGEEPFPQPAPEPPPPEQEGWQLRDLDAPPRSNPYEQHEAFLNFVQLYTGKRQKDPKAWMDYFISPAFLEVMREREFTALLRRTVENQRQTCPPSKEFLRWLSIAYQYSQEEAKDRSGREFRTTAGAGFDGLEDIFQIALHGPIPKRLEGNDLAMFLSFFEYNRLCALAENSGWSDQALTEAGKIVGIYTVSGLQDRCVLRSWDDKIRYPAGVRLLEHFFRRTDLPGELYRILWDKLGLKSALFGRAKVLHGGLRELVLQRVPDVGADEVDVRLLNRERDAYSQRVSQNPEREEEESAAFFQHPELQKALRSRRFVEEQLLHYAFWLGPLTGDGFLRRIREFYQANPSLPCAGQVVEQVDRTFRQQRIIRWDREDKSAPVPQGEPEPADRPFLRHWLNTGFCTAQHPDTRRPLLDYLKENLPYQPEWSRRFLDSPEGGITPRAFTIQVEGVTVETVFHLRYIEYRLDGETACQQCLPWRVLEGVQGRYFFYLLPLAAAFRSQLPQVQQELLRRLEDTAAPAEDREFLAGCLADYVCRLTEPTGEEDDPLDRLPLELFAENEEHLYGASWYRRQGVLFLFEQTSAGRQNLPKGEYDHLYDEDSALALARRLVEEAASPTGYDLSLLRELPWKVHFQPPTGPERVLEREDIMDDEDLAAGKPPLTQEDLEDLLGRFGRGELRRLEMHWFIGELVLIQDRSGYACLFFESGLQGGGWYAMLSMPEVYRTVRHEQTNFLPFGLGRLPDYCLFRDPAPILGNLNQVFPQIGRGDIQTQVGDRQLWARNLSLGNAHNGFLNMIKQKVGGFPPERARNYILTKFLVSRYPVLVQWTNLQGLRTQRQISKGGYGQGNLGLVEFMQQKLAYLRLTWEIPVSEGTLTRRHLVLLQDNGRFMLVWLQDDTQRAEFYVSDVRTYLDVEGKRYPKDTFLGRTVPTYLVHTDLKRLRNCLDLLLDDIDHTDQITGQFAQFAWERPDKPRPYAQIREELLPD